MKPSLPCLGALACAATLVTLCGCAELQPLQEGQKLVGSPDSAVRTTFGEPTGVYRSADGSTRWIYSKQPLGYDVYAADFDSGGRLASFRQMLVSQELYKARVGTWTKRDVEERFGKARWPVQYFPLMKREVWSYRFRPDGYTSGKFHFYFDDQDVLRQTQVTLDMFGGDGGRGR